MNILFVISFLIPGFAAGSFLGGLTLSGNEGLAGSAIDFWYGLFGGIFFFTAGYDKRKLAEGESY